MALGGASMHVFDGSKLAEEQTAHARDNGANAQKLASLLEGAAKAGIAAIVAHNAAAARIAALDDQYHRERTSHDAENAKNRAAVADGTRRLRIAIANAGNEHTSDPSAAAGGMGDGTRRYAELSPAVGKDLFGIVDDADSDARAKAEYLQAYICALQTRGVVSGRCSDENGEASNMVERDGAQLGQRSH
ncbi:MULTISPECIES: lysis system i-spanin subunit Rz [unclassified Caballeronia]|uniref:lysis system i-spanin subunit Rz n=1 Tax=unclassified Caballeronia TaxID=2646786 RepID=UPI0028638A78|nr:MULTISPECIES: lysis system i-spanin subunit Rz [unclassified Caballeronia]MDR5771152.1 lysis system i-spanin subunit Rz [Caballeronia sp. LZ002]MDR5801518.1 lysis system i-spanin subunit Rz [Caballeronia sp. LZ001]MDR5846589.1 lysis system i-spanin subunit Rz [Caballeronia sp. LZ003]